MSNTQHSRLSPSGAHRWAVCAGSVEAESLYPDVTNKYAEEGTLAHEAAANLLRGISNQGLGLTDEILEACEQYKNYIDGLIEGDNYKLLVEHEVDYSSAIPEGERSLGTCDAILIQDDDLHIIDFKYGFGRVEAKENYQLILYAIGAIKSFGLDVIRNVHLHIVQPRINNFDRYHLSRDQLFVWSGFFKSRAIEALKKNAPRTPQESACKWCKAKSMCPALSGLFKDIRKLESEDNTSEEGIRFVLENSNLVSDYINTIQEKTLEKLKLGGKVNGYKLVKGRSVSRLSKDAELSLYTMFGDKIYKKSLLPISKLKEFTTPDVIDQFIVKNEGKLVLATASDKRSEVKALEWNKQQ